MLSGLDGYVRTAAESRLLKCVVRRHKFWECLYPLVHWPHVKQWSQRHGLNPLFVLALIRKESGYHAAIQSCVGARGLMQIMPATAAWTAEKMNVGSYSLDSADDNIKLGTSETRDYVKGVFKNYWNYLCLYNEDVAAQTRRVLMEEGQSATMVGTKSTAATAMTSSSRNYVRVLMEEGESAGEVGTKSTAATIAPSTTDIALHRTGGEGDEGGESEEKGGECEKFESTDRALAMATTARKAPSTSKAVPQRMEEEEGDEGDEGEEKKRDEKDQDGPSTVEEDDGEDSGTESKGEFLSMRQPAVSEKDPSLDRKKC
ncbi:hypothetical protein CBR_g23116 [Chara braunii]|uniref:Transglycosylase SLT domain-containing protein n=1 Tax=Chara braunii TaxID=69332 RepID=A0A388L3S6_CHABU|nr:hypothetical protein CBR_g23116 [Chara braunii]|eukprot:GBG76902.1 hypothetical protein CBR_g23116 [Chara braunii]